MNTLKLAITAVSVSTALLAATLSAPASAYQLDRERLNQCRADLALVYPESRFKLKTVKRVRAESHMRLQVISTEGDTSMVTCWVDREGLTHLRDADGVAIAIPASGEEQLSLK